MFSLLGAQPIPGRTFLPEEGQRGKDRVVVLGHRLWRQRFASDREVIGRSIQLNGEAYTVIGVMPPEFAHPGAFVDLWTPLVLAADFLQNRRRHALHVVARLRTGVSLEQAQGALDRLAAERAGAYPETNKQWGVRVEPIRHLYAGNLLDHVRTMDELAAGTVALRRASMALLAVFAGVAVRLAGLGIYSVMS